MNKLHVILLIGLISLTGNCSKSSVAKDHELIEEWYQLALRLERFTMGFKAPVAARAYSYLGIGAWEMSRPYLDSTYQISYKQIPPSLSDIAPPKDSINLSIALNAYYNTMFIRLFLTAPITIEADQQALYRKWADHDGSKEIAYKSEQYGSEAARRFITWAESDTIGQMGQLHNFDRYYSHPVGQGQWEPCEDFPTPALLPYWGSARTFCIEADSFLGVPPPVFSDSGGNPYFIQALEILSLYSQLSHENRWIAEYWSDDHPSLTFSASGRWISIANQIIDEEEPYVDKILFTYGLLGLVLNDAMVTCWNSKYIYNTLRPETYIRRYFQPDWRPLTHTPPFPGYPAGHAVVAMAAAEVLTHLYGPEYAITDRSHLGRVEFLSKPRSFKSIYALAEENAYSRIALGVHFRMDCDEGVRVGSILGKEIIQQYVKSNPSSL